MPAAIDLATILKGLPAGAWVAVGDNKVIAYGADMQTVLATARQAGEKNPLILKVPDRQEVLFL
jgi:hypothetical protein